MRRFCVFIVAVAMISPAFAGEDDVKLKDKAGRSVVEANCAACHSLDYIIMNSPFLDKPGWEATVKKMIDRFGAPVDQADSVAITNYLAANYGR